MAKPLTRAAQLSESAGGGSSSGSGSSTSAIPHFYQLDFAYATRTVLYVMAGIMAAAAIVAILGLRRGVQEESAGAQADDTAETPETTGAYVAGAAGGFGKVDGAGGAAEVSGAGDAGGAGEVRVVGETGTAGPVA